MTSSATSVLSGSPLELATPTNGEGPKLPSTIRDPNLDLLRGAAIAIVLIHHLSLPQRVPWIGESVLVTAFFQSGAFSIDLFFALSGWLIGGLYWRELREQGRVEISRFLVRRWLRTLIPYYGICLPMMVMAAHGPPGASMSSRFLWFGQNYQASLEVWEVSWSLCVEEHFYLVLPLALVTTRWLGHRIQWLFLALILMSMVGRWTWWSGAHEFVRDPFWGPQWIRTHFRLEGLVGGVWASYLCYYLPVAWSRLRRLARVVAPVVPVAVVALVFIPSPWLAGFGFTIADGLSILLVVAVTGARPIAGSRSAVIRFLALTSYSLYLVHIQAFQLGEFLAQRVAISGTLPVVALQAVLALAVGSVAYLFLERPAFRVREFVAPKRHLSARSS